MTLQITDNFADNSTEAGFQLTFFCAICNESYKTKFISSKSCKKGKFFKGLGGLLGAAAQIAGKSGIGYGIEKGTDVVGERFSGMSPEWQKEYDAAFEKAQTETKAHFIAAPNAPSGFVKTTGMNKKAFVQNALRERRLKWLLLEPRRKLRILQQKPRQPRFLLNQ